MTTGSAQHVRHVGLKIGHRKIDFEIFRLGTVYLYLGKSLRGNKVLQNLSATRVPRSFYRGVRKD